MVVRRQRLFQPGAVQALVFAGGVERAAEIPHHARLPRARGLRLVGICFSGPPPTSPPLAGLASMKALSHLIGGSARYLQIYA